jgi:hypothetical protein
MRATTRESFQFGEGRKLRDREARSPHLSMNRQAISRRGVQGPGALAKSGPPLRNRRRGPGSRRAGPRGPIVRCPVDPDRCRPADVQKRDRIRPRRHVAVKPPNQGTDKGKSGGSLIRYASLFCVLEQGVAFGSKDVHQAEPRREPSVPAAAVRSISTRRCRAGRQIARLGRGLFRSVRAPGRAPHRVLTPFVYAPETTKPAYKAGFVL